jgi:hypothetical protein
MCTDPAGLKSENQAVGQPVTQQRKLFLNRAVHGISLVHFSSIEGITQATEGSPLVGNPMHLRTGSGQWCDFGENVGSEQCKERAALIVQKDAKEYSTHFSGVLISMQESRRYTFATQE